MIVYITELKELLDALDYMFDKYDSNKNDPYFLASLSKTEEEWIEIVRDCNYRIRIATDGKFRESVYDNSGRSYIQTYNRCSYWVDSMPSTIYTMWNLYKKFLYRERIIDEI